MNNYFAMEQDPGQGRPGRGRRGRGDWGGGGRHDHGPGQGHGHHEQQMGGFGPMAAGGQGPMGQMGPMGWGPRGPRGGDERGADFGPGPHGRGSHGRGRGRRGDVRAAVLNLLSEQEMTGYQLMGAIEEKSQGLWKPGPGSVYPALQLLADEGLIALVGGDGEGRKPYGITEAGTAYLAEHADETKAPWDRVTSDMQGVRSLRPELEKLSAAVRQAAMVTGAAQQAKVKEVLTRARKDVYRILADDDAEETGVDDQS